MFEIMCYSRAGPAPNFELAKKPGESEPMLTLGKGMLKLPSNCHQNSSKPSRCIDGLSHNPL